MGIRIIFIILFVVISSLPTLLMPFYKNENAAEKRTMAAAPAFSFERIFTFLDEWQLYYSDHFALRDRLSEGFIHFKRHVLKADPLPRKVREGKDGWFYLGDNFWNVYHASIGAERINEMEMNRVVAAISDMKSFCDSLNTGFYMLIAPDKHTIYPEYLPIRPNTNNPSKHDVLKQRLDKEVPGLGLIDLRAGLLRMKDSVKVYFKTDSHWNSLGAAYGTQQLIEKISKRYPVGAWSLKDYVVTEKHTMQMDETGMLRIKVPESYLSLEPVAGRGPAYQETVTDEYMMRTNNNASRLKVVVFRDSFFEAMLPFFAPCVGDALYIWNDRINKNRILEEKPDFVILEVVERGILEIRI